MHDDRPSPSTALASRQDPRALFANPARFRFAKYSPTKGRIGALRVNLSSRLSWKSLRAGRKHSDQRQPFGKAFMNDLEDLQNE